MQNGMSTVTSQLDFCSEEITKFAYLVELPLLADSSSFGFDNSFRSTFTKIRNNSHYIVLFSGLPLFVVLMFSLSKSM